LKQYYQLTKPGIVRGNAIPAIAGFLLASHRHVNYVLLIEMLVGVSLIIAGACVYNNYIDRDIDTKMSRTKNRALARGLISKRLALSYASVLALIGFTFLALYTNMLTLGIGIVGIFAYVVVYGIAKRRSVHGTLVGSISGALPPVAGYTAVSGHLNATALTLFFILVFWQMPHFYSIAIYRLRDYRAAKLPVLPAVKGLAATKRQIIFYIVAFGVAASLLGPIAHTGLGYLSVAVLVSLLWLYSGLKGFHAPDADRWAKKMFGLSLLVLLVLCIAIGISGLLA